MKWSVFQENWERLQTPWNSNTNCASNIRELSPSPRQSSEKLFSNNWAFLDLQNLLYSYLTLVYSCQKMKMKGWDHPLFIFFYSSWPKFYYKKAH